MWFNLSFFIQAIQALLVPGYFPPTCKAHCETNGENNEISKSRFVFIIMVTALCYEDGRGQPRRPAAAMWHP